MPGTLPFSQWIPYKDNIVTMSKLTPTDTIHVNASDLKKGFFVKPGFSYTFVVHQEKAQVEVIEAEDVLFRTDSAVFLPYAMPQDEPEDDSPMESHDDPLPEQTKVSGLAVIGGLFRYYQLCLDRGDTKYLLVTGHADTSGKESYNEKLSLMRANVVTYLILGDTPSREAFAKIVDEKHTNEDLQQVLKWLGSKLGTPDPGDIDGKIGDKTNTAIREVKRCLSATDFHMHHKMNASFSEKFESNRLSLKNNTYFGKILWEVIFELYQAHLEETLYNDGFDIHSIRKDLKWVTADPNAKEDPQEDSQQNSPKEAPQLAVGCGETWPLVARGEDNYKSAANRRVEILFYDPEEITDSNGEMIKLPCKEDKCAKEDCHIFKDLDKYNPGALETKLEWEYIEMDAEGNLSRTVIFDLHIASEKNPDEDSENTYIVTLMTDNDSGEVYNKSISISEKNNADVEKISDSWYRLRFKNVFSLSSPYSLIISKNGDSDEADEPYIVYQNISFHLDSFYYNNTTDWGDELTVSVEKCETSDDDDPFSGECEVPPDLTAEE